MKRWTLAAILCALLVSGCGHGGEEKPKGQESGKAPPEPAVVVDTVKVKHVELSQTFAATLDAEGNVDVRARVEGNLMDFSFREGHPVGAGQVLFQIDPREYQASVQAARAQLRKAQANLAYAQNQVALQAAKAELEQARYELIKAQRDVDRYRPLAANEVIPQQTYDDSVTARDAAGSQVEAAEAQVRNTALQTSSDIDVARATVASAQADLETAQLQLSYCTITSPISGIIGKLNVTTGNLVGSPGNTTPLVTISQSDPIYAYFSVSEAQYLKAVSRADGQDRREPEVELLLVDGSTYPYKGRLSMADRAFDAKTGTLQIRSIFPNSRAVLRPGGFARVRFEVQTIPRALVIPQKAVTEQLATEQVYVLGEGNVVQARSIEILTDYGDEYIIKEGVKEGETIIVEGLQKVKPGMKVKPSTAPARKGS